MEIERCTHCFRAYEVSEMGGAMPGSKEPEDITCPHCRHTYTQRTNGIFRTHPLSSAQEREYDLAHPPQYSQADHTCGFVVSVDTPTSEIRSKLQKISRMDSDRIVILDLGPDSVRARADWSEIEGTAKAIARRRFSVECVTQARIEALATQISILA